MPRLQEPIYLQVEFEVFRYTDYPEDKFLQIWGYVGDYEVCISLPYTDRRVQRLRRQRVQD